MTLQNVPGPVENAHYWEPYFKNHVLPDGTTTKSKVTFGESACAGSSTPILTQ